MDVELNFRFDDDPYSFAKYKANHCNRSMIGLYCVCISDFYRGCWPACKRFIALEVNCDKTNEITQINNSHFSVDKKKTTLKL